jgi:signal transduction histidine kinase
MRPLVPAWPTRAIVCLSLLLGRPPVAAATVEPTPSARPPPLATNLLQLHSLAAQSRRIVCSVELDATVCASNAAKDLLALQDHSAAELLQLELHGQPFSPGQQVRLKAARCLLSLADCGLKLRPGPVVDNDGTHAMTRRTGTVYLKAGPHPVRLDWFNGPDRYGLAVDYERPGCPRQPVPDSALFRAMPEAAHGGANPAGGLDYRVYEGDWGKLLPDFRQLTPVKTGTATNFDIGVRTRDEHVGIQFSGFLAVPQDGLYTFSTVSDDGSMLYVGDAAPRLEVVGSGPPPVPRRMVLGQILSEQEQGQWAEWEGTVLLVNEQGDGLELELASGNERARVIVADGSKLASVRLWHSRIRAAGVCQSVYTTEGQRVVGELVVPGDAQIAFLETTPDLQNPPPLTATHTAWREDSARPPAEAVGLPVLTTAEEVKRLTRAQAQLGYPVRLRGVITHMRPWATTLVLQDATCGVFVRGIPSAVKAPRQGEYWEIGGVTGPGDFAPVVNARRWSYLGVGRLPDPVSASWDQLMNGSLDTQYVEIRGIVTAAQTNGLELRLREGKIHLALPDVTAEALSRYRDSLIRVRGCLFPAWNRQTHLLRVGEMEIPCPSVSVEEAPPPDPFSAPRKQAAELLLFDPQAGAFQRVKVAGQILGVRDGQYFMVDGTNGLRITPKEAAGLEVGDLAEAVGFPELVPSPVLREAVVRKVGHAALPQPRSLRPENWLEADNDSTLVRVEGVLVHLRTRRAEQELELQAGWRTFLARLNGKEKLAQSVPLGSRVELTGVYAAQGGNPTLGRAIGSFELLLNSAADLRVLARPPWLTLPRVLGALGVVAMILLGAMFWALSLRRRVSAQAAIIRQKAQREAAHEERARIAKDIHDDVGSSLTFITMLGEQCREDIAKPRELAIHTDKIVTYARGTVQALDEIVWAINPQNDTLDALVGYLNQYAGQFFESTNVRCRLDVPETLSSVVLPTEVRHDLFLVVKEALNNVLKHAQASEVSVAITESPGVLEIAIEDNGRGFDAATSAGSRPGDGLNNMRKRMAKIGGGFFFASLPGQGTKLRLTVKVNGDRPVKPSNG